jgi:hypothetical protein
MTKQPPKYSHIQNPSTRIYWDDLHAEPGLKIVSLAARGLWTYHMLAIMAAAGGYLALEGTPLTVEALAALVGKPFQEVSAAFQELSTWKVFSVDRFGTPYNRRMVKAQRKVETNRKNGQKGGRQKSLNLKANSDLETQMSSEALANTNPNDGPRARGSQDSSMNPDIIHTSEKNPASAGTNGHGRRNGHSRPLTNGEVMKRIVRTLELPDTKPARLLALHLQEVMPPDELQELYDPATAIGRVSGILQRAKSIHDGS